MAKYNSDAPIDDNATYGIRLLTDEQASAIIEVSGLELKTLIRLLTVLS